MSLPIEKFLFVQMVAMISLLNLNKFGRLKKINFIKEFQNNFTNSGWVEVWWGPGG